MMILHICVDHDPERISIDFGVKRSKGKVIFGLWTFYHFHTITPFPFGIHWWYFTHVLAMIRGRPLLILGSKGKRSRSYWTLSSLLFLHDNSISFWHTMMILHACIILTMIWEGPLLILGTKGQRSRSYLYMFFEWTFYCFRMKTPFPFGMHMYWPWPEEDLYWF